MAIIIDAPPDRQDMAMWFNIVIIKMTIGYWAKKPDSIETVWFFRLIIQIFKMATNRVTGVGCDYDGNVGVEN